MAQRSYKWCPDPVLAWCNNRLRRLKFQSGNLSGLITIWIFWTRLYRIMYELPWMMIFGPRVSDLSMNFTSDEVTRENHWQIASRVTPKIVIYDNECIISFLTRYFMSWTHNFATNSQWSLISPLPSRTVFSDLTLWLHHRWSVLSPKRGVLVLWLHIRWLFLHAQIGTKAIFNCV